MNSRGYLGFLSFNLGCLFLWLITSLFWSNHWRFNRFISCILIWSLMNRWVNLQIEGNMLDKKVKMTIWVKCLVTFFYLGGLFFDFLCKQFLFGFSWCLVLYWSFSENGIWSVFNLFNKTSSVVEILLIFMTLFECYLFNLRQSFLIMMLKFYSFKLKLINRFKLNWFNFLKFEITERWFGRRIFDILSCALKIFQNLYFDEKEKRR